jgi:hypothetical protein
MKVVLRNKLQAILSCFPATNPTKDKSLTNRKIHQKLHFSLPLRMLFCFRDWPMEDAAMERKELLRCSLQDLFVSSPPEQFQLQCSSNEVLDAQIDMSRRRGTTDQINGSGMYRRFRFANLRHRLLRRSWRPALVAIPE